MKKTLFIITCLFLLYSISSCSKLVTNDNAAKTLSESIIKEIESSHMPKSGEGVLKISSEVINDTIFIKGSTTEEKALQALKDKLEQESINFTIINNVKLLPNTEAINDLLFGVINVSVADIRTQNRYTAGMATQAMLGTPVKILDKENGWFFIQTPDTYYGWVHGRQVTPMNKEKYNEWLSTPKIVFTEHYGFATASTNKNNGIVSDVVSGNVLNMLSSEGNYYKVAYPDGRTAYVLKSEAEDYNAWLASRKPTVSNFLKVANSMKGIPYVWGGTSAKGVDCSGLISTTLKLHGLLILRDASQQATIGEPVDISSGYENLKPGDLLFFGKAEDKIRHVAFYLGNNKFLHASDYTRVNSLNPEDDDYDESNTKEFVKAKRIIDDEGNLYGVEKIVNNSFYQTQK